MKKGNKYTNVITYFIKEDSIKLNQRNPSFWAREVKIVKQLMELYPEEDFWKTLSADFKLNSMAFFKTPDGEKLLSLKYQLFRTEVKTEIIAVDLFGEKVGEDIEIKKNKNRSVKDFLT